MKKTVFFLLVFSAGIVGYSQNFELIDTWHKNKSAIECITLSPEGDKILVGHHDGSLALWDLNKKMMVAEYHAHNDQIQTIIFNQDKTKFVTAAYDGKVVLWEYPSMKVLKTYKTTENVNYFAVITPDGNSIYLGGYNTKSTYTDLPYSAIYKIDVRSGVETIAYIPKQGSTNQTTITDGDFDLTEDYIVITKDQNVLFYNWRTRKVDKTIKCEHPLNNFIFYKNKAFVWGDKMLMRMELSDNGKYEITHTVLAGTHDSYSGYSEMIVSKDEKILVTGDDDNNVNIWDAESMIKKQILFGHTDAVRAFIFCQNDTVLITGGYDGQLLIWSYKREVVKEVEEEKEQEVIFAENNIPLVIRDRGVDLQSNLKINKDEFDIQIYDNRVEDGDSISLNLNGEWILKDHRVTKAKKTIHVKINPNYTNNYLILYAHNLGDISPNTAAVTVLIGGQEYRLSLSSDLKKSGALNFEYKP